MGVDFKRNRPAIEAIEPRLHFSVNIGARPIDLGNFANPSVDRVAVSPTTALPHAFLFTVPQTERGRFGDDA